MQDRCLLKFTIELFFSFRMSFSSFFYPLPLLLLSASIFWFFIFWFYLLSFGMLVSFKKMLLDGSKSSFSLLGLDYYLLFTFTKEAFTLSITDNLFVLSNSFLDTFLFILLFFLKFKLIPVFSVSSIRLICFKLLSYPPLCSSLWIWLLSFNSCGESGSNNYFLESSSISISL